MNKRKDVMEIGKIAVAGIKILRNPQ